MHDTMLTAVLILRYRHFDLHDFQEIFSLIAKQNEITSKQKHATTHDDDNNNY